MFKRLEELSMDLASGMSRRKALWRFVGGAGAAVLMASKGKAAGNNVCVEMCKTWADELGPHAPDNFIGKCVSASAHCPKGQCAYVKVTNGGQVVELGCFPV